MIAVDSITEQELDKRFDILSGKLKDTLTSERSISVVNQICEKNKIIDGEKITIIHQLVGLVILGLVHSYDLGAEINDALSLENPKFSNAIAEELNAKVFLPIKIELENNYHPINPAPAEKNGSLPKLIPAVITVATPTPKPTTLSDIGWSKQPATGSNIGVSAAVPTPAPAPKPTPNPSRPPVVPVIIPKPTAVTAAAEPAPMMLHEDTTFKPAEKNVGFTLAKPQGGAEMSFGKGSTAAPARPAVLEFGGDMKAPIPKPPAPALSSIHPITVNIGTRNVSQILPMTSAPVPKPPTPPMPPQAPVYAPSLQIPQPPKPPSPTQNIPAAPQPGKPIVKDFL